jgi:hypothetical protein
MKLPAFIAVAIIVFLSGTTARAADGDDRLRLMEDMIAEQQAQIASQQAQILMLSRQVQQLVTGAKAAGRTATTTPIAPGRSAEIVPPRAASAKTVRTKPAPVSSGGKKASLTLSGQVNRAAMFYDDGTSSDVRSVDNDNSSTRVRLKGKVSPRDGVIVGSTIEVEIESNSSRSVTQDDNTSAEGTSNDGIRGSSDVTFNERIIELYVDSNKYGKVSLGQGNTASDKTFESDLSGTKLVASSDVKDVGGKLVFARRNGVFSTVTVDTAFNNMDGLGRRDRIRYDTPFYRGLRASGSLIDGGAWDAALHYGQKLFTFKVIAAAGYANTSSISSSMESQFSGSLSVLHNSGLNFTIAGATRDMTGSASNQDPRSIYGKLGYKAKLIKFGYTAVSVDYRGTWDLPSNGAEGDSMAFAVVQHVTDWGTELYASYRRLKLDIPGSGIDDLDTVLAGARITF